MGTSVKIKKLYEQMRHKLIFTVCCCSVIRSAYKHKYMCDWVCVFEVSVVVVPSSEKRRTSLHFIFGSLIVIQCEKLFLCTSNDFVWNHCRHYVFHVHYVSLPLPNDNAKGQRLWFAWWLHSMIVILWLCRMQTHHRNLKESDWDYCIVRLSFMTKSH